MCIPPSHFDHLHFRHPPLLNLKPILYLHRKYWHTASRGWHSPWPTYPGLLKLLFGQIDFTLYRLFDQWNFEEISYIWICKLLACASKKLLALEQVCKKTECQVLRGWDHVSEWYMVQSRRVYIILFDTMYDTLPLPLCLFCATPSPILNTVHCRRYISQWKHKQHIPLRLTLVEKLNTVY